MKNRLALFLSALLLLSLCACGGSGNQTTTQQEASTSPEQDATTPDAATAETALTPVTSEEEVRALYADEVTDTAALVITEYEGDYLVQSGKSPNAEWLDWVYGQSGIRRRMLWLDAELVDLEIVSSATIRAVVGGSNIYYGELGFPRVERVSLNTLYDELGQPMDYSVADNVGDGTSEAVSTETYWANAGESWRMGTGRREAIRGAQIDAGGINVAFAPLADGSDFVAAFCTIPLTTVALSEDNSTLTVTMRDTYLDSGTLKADVDQPFLDFLLEYGSLYPNDFPEGELTGSCFLIQSAELHQEGDDAVLTVHMNTDYLTGDRWSGKKYFQFNGSTGYTGIADVGPYLRVQLRATSELFDY